MTAIARKPFEIRGWHVLAGIVAFFGVVFAVDGTFMYQAIHTFPGQTVDNPYEAGLAYNRTIAQRQAEAALGWSASVEKGEGVVRLMILDRTAQPLEGLTVSGKLERPATETGRRMIELKEVAPGLYEAAVNDMTGAWDFSATARDGAGHVFEAQRRLIW
ncbi:MAG TPA: FixH family protein [Caulobacteraceae bacterium]